MYKRGICTVQAKVSMELLKVPLVSLPTLVKTKYFSNFSLKVINNRERISFHEDLKIS